MGGHKEWHSDLYVSWRALRLTLLKQNNSNIIINIFEYYSINH